MMGLLHRLATRADLAALTALMDAAIGELQKPFLSQAEIASSRMIMGLDTQLIDDGTYFVVESASTIVGCGGWSRRQSLFGSDAGRAAMASALIDPARDAARIRAFFVHPDHARQGVGRLIMEACENAIAQAQFHAIELVATLAGEPLYAAFAYTVIERFDIPLPGGLFLPAVRMTKTL